MIINSKTVNLSTAGQMLGMDEQEVFKLAQHGLISQGVPTKGSTTLYLHSIEKYARRNGIELKQPAPPATPRDFKSYSISQATQLLGVAERQLHVMIQQGKLQAGFEGKEYRISGQSLHNYVTGKGN